MSLHIFRPRHLQIGFQAIEELPCHIHRVLEIDVDFAFLSQSGYDFWSVDFWIATVGALTTLKPQELESNLDSSFVFVAYGTQDYACRQSRVDA